MHSNYVAASILAFASYVAAQTSGFDPISYPTQDLEVAAGSTLDIVWDSTVSEKVTITLLQGATSSTLQLGDDIATSIDSSLGTYAWAAPASAEYATYGFKLTLDSNTSTFQYSFPFHVSGSSSSSSSSVASSTAASSTAASSAAAATVSSAAGAETTSLSQAEVVSSAAGSSAAATTAAAASGSASSAASTLSTVTASAGFATSTSKSNSTKTNVTASSTATFATATGGAVSRSVGTLGLAAGLAVAFGMTI